MAIFNNLVFRNVTFALGNFSFSVAFVNLSGDKSSSNCFRSRYLDLYPPKAPSPMFPISFRGLSSSETFFIFPLSSATQSAAKSQLYDIFLTYLFFFLPAYWSISASFSFPQPAILIEAARAWILDHCMRLPSPLPPLGPSPCQAILPFTTRFIFLTLNKISHSKTFSSFSLPAE